MKCRPSFFFLLSLSFSSRSWLVTRFLFLDRRKGKSRQSFFYDHFRAPPPPPPSPPGTGDVFSFSPFSCAWMGLSAKKYLPTFSLPPPSFLQRALRFYFLFCVCGDAYPFPFFLWNSIKKGPLPFFFPSLQEAAGDFFFFFFPPSSQNGSLDLALRLEKGMLFFSPPSPPSLLTAIMAKSFLNAPPFFFSHYPLYGVRISDVFRFLAREN